jgi:hypothetical protein
MTIDDICRELNNWFDETADGQRDRHFGAYEISGGEIDLSDTGIKAGQYFRIVGSVFNDGIHQYPADGLTDETFDGAVWIMAVPKAVLDLLEEIGKWEQKYGGADSAAMSPFTSESFGGYSYSKSAAGSGSADAGDAGSWQAAFRSRLNKWRKIRP